MFETDRPVATPQTWRLSRNGGMASFRINGLLFRGVMGTMPVRSVQVVVTAGGQPTRVEAVLDPAAIETGSARLDARLRSERFLDVERHPEARFVSSSIVASSAGWAVTGELHVRDIVTRVVLDVRETASVLRGLANLHATARVDHPGRLSRALHLGAGRLAEVEIVLSLSRTTDEFSGRVTSTY